MNEQEIREKFGWKNRSAHSNIIIDRKKKRYAFGLDEQFNDPLGVEEARKGKSNTIEIEKGSINPIDKYLMEHTPKELIGKKVWCMKKKSNKTYSGWVVDVYPARVLLVRSNDLNLPTTFESVIAMQGAEK